MERAQGGHNDGKGAASARGREQALNLPAPSVSRSVWGRKPREGEKKTEAVRN
jgi:hypothetical protein